MGAAHGPQALDPSGPWVFHCYCHWGCTGPAEECWSQCWCLGLVAGPCVGQFPWGHLPRPHRMLSMLVLLSLLTTTSGHPLKSLVLSVSTVRKLCLVEMHLTIVGLLFIPILASHSDDR